MQCWSFKPHASWLSLHVPEPPTVQILVSKAETTDGLSLEGYADVLLGVSLFGKFQEGDEVRTRSEVRSTRSLFRRSTLVGGRGNTLKTGV